jgi:hypothetical protein
MKERVVEKVVYIKTPEELKDAKNKASVKTQTIIDMLNKGMKTSDVAMSLGVPKSLVSGLSNVLGFRAWGMRDSSRFYEWMELAKPMLVLPIKTLKLSGTTQWKIKEINQDNQTITIEYK